MAKTATEFGQIKYKVFEGMDNIFDEKGSQFCAFRKVAWYNPDKNEEPTTDDAHWELRRWRANDSGVDAPVKGMTFLTEEGPSNLAKLLLDKGYGSTKDCLLSLKKRDDFREAVEHMYDEEEANSEEFFDARDELLAE
jgi:hypothetical protein